MIGGSTTGSVAAVSVLAIDLGTGSVKVALVADDLTVLRQASRPYPVLSPEPGAALGDPADWAQAVEAAVTEVLTGDRQHRSPEPLHGVGLSGQMHGLVLLDVLGATVGPALLWPDTRAGLELRRLAAGPVAIAERQLGGHEQRLVGEAGRAHRDGCLAVRISASVHALPP